MIVMKFGGTSVGSSKMIMKVAKLIIDARSKIQVIAVVSAMSGVTDLLVSAAKNAANNDRLNLELDLNKLEKIHLETIIELKLNKVDEKKLINNIKEKLSSLTSSLDAICDNGRITLQDYDQVVSYGERLSIQLVSNAINKLGHQAQPFEANELIVTTDEFGDARPLLIESTNQAKPKITQSIKNNKIPIITGFIGATSEGLITTFGRGGSDYSATIIGHCIDAYEVWIWTDVDGVMTADPRLICNARTIANLSYDEAAELSYFGAKVLHPLTIVPASLKNIPIRVKNTFNPKSAGTMISKKKKISKSTEKAISVTKIMSLIEIKLSKIVCPDDIKVKALDAMASENIDITLSLVNPTNHQISFVVRQQDSLNTINALTKTFQSQLAATDIKSIKHIDDLVIVTIVGESIKPQTNDITAKILSALKKSKINIYAINQNPSKRSISLIIAESDKLRTIGELHDRLCLIDNNAKSSND